MKRLQLKALVLAAGKGERLRPLTGMLPKPLLPVAGRPVAAYTLARLASVGCVAAALNLHHRGQQICDHFGASLGNMSIVYSWEESLLGTLGALAPLRDFFSGADLVLLINGDSLCRWPLKRMVRRHQSKKADATMLLSEVADPAEFDGGVGVDERGRVVHLRGGGLTPEAESVVKRCVFAGAHILSPRLLKGLTDGPSDVIGDLYIPLLNAGGHIEAVLTKRPWHDLGTPRRYLRGAYDWPRGRFPQCLWRRNWVARGARTESRVRLRGSVVESGARIETRSRLEKSLILPGATIGRGSNLRECIVAAGVALPPETWVERRMITPLKAGRALSGTDSVLGNLVYTPMDLY